MAVAGFIWQELREKILLIKTDVVIDFNHFYLKNRVQQYYFFLCPDLFYSDFKPLQFTVSNN